MDEFVRQHVAGIASGLAIAGVLIGYGLNRWSQAMCRAFRKSQNLPPVAAGSVVRLPLVELGLAVAFVSYFYLVFGFELQRVVEHGAHSTPTVRPAEFWKYGRAVGHLILISLLVTATATDLREYIIPDSITLPGTFIGLVLATASGDTQLMHVWVDWNQAMQDLRGPWIPDWIKEHQHLHGLAWSLTGIAAGAGVTWVTRWLSSLILGQEALGQGDITLMAMIGSFLGWQPVVFVFALAPLCGVAVGLLVRLLTNRSYVSFGPYLSFSAIAVMLTWRQLWMLEVANEFSVRLLFGDGIGLAILAGISVAAFVLLLGSLRLYRLIPGRQAE